MEATVADVRIMCGYELGKGSGQHCALDRGHEGAIHMTEAEVARGEMVRET